MLAVNKVDNYEKFVLDTYEFYNLGLGTPFPVSANSKIGFGDLLDEVLVHCNPQNADEKKMKDQELQSSESQMQENLH